MSKPIKQIAFDFDETPLPSVAPKPPALIEVPETDAAEQPEKLSGATEEPEADKEIEIEEIAFITVEEVEKPAVAKKTGSTRGRKSLKEIALTADLTDIPTDEELFKKSYYPIGEVARMFRENQSLIRYWESEFDILKPKKNGKGDRYFRPVDIKNLVLIHDLLRRRKFTIEGAKDYLKKNKKAEDHFAMIQSLEKMKSFFLELRASLQSGSI